MLFLERGIYNFGLLCGNTLMGKHTEPAALDFSCRSLPLRLQDVRWGQQQDLRVTCHQLPEPHFSGGFNCLRLSQRLLTDLRLSSISKYIKVTTHLMLLDLTVCSVSSFILPLTGFKKLILSNWSCYSVKAKLKIIHLKFWFYNCINVCELQKKYMSEEINKEQWEVLGSICSTMTRGRINSGYNRLLEL